MKGRGGCCLAGKIALIVGVVMLLFLFGSFKLLLTIASIVLVLIGLSCLLFRY